MVCGKDLKYFDPARELMCVKCGGEFETAASCEDGHFVCDACHARSGYDIISEFAARAESKNPVAIAEDMMRDVFINMHGPEHHFLVAAALLAAYRNSGGRIDFEKALAQARERGRKVPGGICGFWGCCGAAVGSGIFVSAVTGATPMSEGEWSLANKMTSLSLEAVSKNGGPRCCKRNTYLAVLTAVDFAREGLKVEMEKPAAITCSFFSGNPSCRKDGCLFYPSEKRSAA